MSPRLRAFLFKLNLALLGLVTLNLWVLLLSKGYAFALGSLKISSHRPGRLFLYQIILVALLRLFFYEEFKGSWKRRKPDEVLEHKTSRLFLAGVCLIISLAALLAYAGTLSSYFLSDDFEFLKLFHKSQSLSRDALIGYFKNFGLLRPLSLLTLEMDYRIWGLNSFGYHLSSLLFHVGSAWLVFLFLWHLTRDRYISSLAGLLFSVYPLHLEAVAWISGRFDVTCTFFYLLSLVLFLYFRRSDNLVLMWLSLLSFLGALLCKEMAMTLPALIFAVDFIFDGGRDGRWREALKRSLIYALFLAGYVILRILLLGGISGSSYAANALAFFKGNVITGLKHFLSRPFGPLFVPLNKTATASAGLLETGILIALSLLILSVLLRPRLPFKMCLFGLLFIFVTAIPTLKILYITDTLQGSRFLYLPSAGACLILAVLVKADSFSKRKAVEALRFLLPSAVIILFLLMHRVNSQPWKQAGAASKTMVEQALRPIRSLPPPQQVFVLYLPDNIQGAYIFRNGFSAALDLLGKPDGLEIIDLKKLSPGELKESDIYTVLAWKQGNFSVCKAPGKTLMNYNNNKVR